MKKFIPIAILTIALFSLTSAQDDARLAQGQIEFGGDVGFNMTTYSFEDAEYPVDNSTILTLYPRFGYFVIPNLEIEPRLIFSRMATNYTDEFKSAFDVEDASFTIFGGVLNVVYNFPMEGQVIPFVFAGGGFQTYSSSDEPEDGYETTLILPDAGAGIKAFISDRGVIRAEIFFERHDKAGGVEDLTTNNFGIRAGFSVFLK